MSNSRPAAMPAPQAAALAAILDVTRREWEAKGLLRDGGKSGDTGKLAAKEVRKDARKANGRDRRGSALATLAALAFEAQVMALRCRQAFVG